MATNQYFIGLMSGTSLDGVDIALVTVSPSGSIKLVDFQCSTLPVTLSEQLAEVSIADMVSLELVGQLGIQLAKLCAQGCLDILAKNGFNPTANHCHRQPRCHY